MTMPPKHSKSPDTTRPAGTRPSAPMAAVQPVASSPLDPQLIPFLDLLADLLSQAFKMQDDGRPASSSRQDSDSQAIADGQIPPLTGAEDPGKAGPIPTFPRDSQADCREIPKNTVD